MPFATIISFFAGPPSATTGAGDRSVINDAFRLWSVRGTTSVEATTVEENTNTTQTDFETTPFVTISSILFAPKAQNATTTTGSQAPALAHTFPLNEVEQSESAPESTTTIPVFKSIMDPTIVSNNPIGLRPTATVSYKLSKLNKVVYFTVTKPCREL